MRSAFTLIEILTAIFVLIIVVAISVPITTDLYRSYVINAEINSLINVLRRTQSFSMSRPQEGPLGVKVENDKITVFRGESFSERDVLFDELYNVSFIASIFGPSEIIFEPLSGNVSPSSTWTISVGPYSRSVSINEHGTVDW